MTSSDPTPDPGPVADAEPSTDLVPHDQPGEVVDPNASEPDSTDQPSDQAIGRKSRPEPPEFNRQTRISAAWVAVAVGVVVLVLLLIFILQNLKSVTVTYFSAHGTMPLGVLLLFAAAGGALLVIVLGFARMLQMRLLARRDRRSIH